MKFTSSYFGKTAQGESITLFTLENNRNFSVKISNYGATVTSIICPDKNGISADVALGFDKLEQYMAEHPYFGVICGRYANRISKGVFAIEGKKYLLPINNGANTLHGGFKGFHTVVWHAVPFKTSEEVGVKLTYLSKDGEEGFPGNLLIKVTYSINDLNELRIAYSAETDTPTVVNLTNHTYFNLNGCSSTVLDHIMTINADKYTEVDNEAIPTGKLPDVKGTAFDFRRAKRVSDDIEKAGGYDHNFVLNKSNEKELSFAGLAYDPQSGRTLETFTTEPGIQFYTANFLDGSLNGKNGIQYKKHYGFCWETQHFPDSPNQNHFPSTRLNPGELYTQLTIYRFGTR